MMIVALAPRVWTQAITLAHHADDQTETMLLKLLRGCHLSSLRGMDWRRWVIRPGRPRLRKSHLALFHGFSVVCRGTGLHAHVCHKPQPAQLSGAPCQ